MPELNSFIGISKYVVEGKGRRMVGDTFSQSYDVDGPRLS